jgi:uncharacterized phage protein gp47/JayE
MSGLTTAGFERKRLADIKTEIEDSLKNSLGASINLTPPSVFATIIGIFAEREDLVWQLAENVYNSSYPDTAEGTSLDNVVAITGITRQPATESTVANVNLFGTAGTNVPAGTVFSVDGNPDARFETDAGVTLVAGTDEIQNVAFSATPTSGSFRLVYEDESTSLIPFTANAAAVQAALNALTDLSGVTVSGSFAAGFAVTFAGDDGKIDQPALTISDNTLDNAGAVTITITTPTPGVPQAVVNCTAQSAGATQAPARTLTVIETPVAGLDSVLNMTDAVVGRDTETDVELRLRRSQSLQVAGAATVEAIISSLRNVEDVSAVIVIENDTDAVDGEGRPPHSFEAIVQGGADQAIADEIWATKPAGIATFGTETENVTDSIGVVHSIKFSRPAPVDIYIILDLTTDSNFPVDGATQAENLILARAAERFGIGDDVIVIPTLIAAIDPIPGILDAVIKVGTAPGPTLDNNIPIAVGEVASFDSSRITVNVI